ncbi:hypothetical protein NESM_000181000 [Novymonas esmeraldas]|uniref:Uncharacterized protein n=1 Tax=Novymonas esmeraldas TaxID=1808958 RepID=A0AAW0F4R8_9TRYP
MEDSHFERVTYDMPQEQLNYFDSRARASPAFVPSVPVRVLEDKATPGCNHEMRRRTQQQAESDASEPRSVAQEGSLSQRYQQYFAERQVDGSEPRLANFGNSSSGFHAREKTNPHQAHSSQTSSAQRTQPADESKPGSHRRSYRERAMEADDFYWSHNAPPSSHGSAPRVQPSAGASRPSRYTSSSTAERPSTSVNSYEQPHGDRHAPLRKSSVSQATPTSRGSASERSASARSRDDDGAAAPPGASVEGAAERPPVQVRRISVRSYVPRQTETIRPVREVAESARDGSSSTVRRVSVPKEEDAEYERLRDEEENCTFQPRINNPSRPRRSNVRDSPYRRSDEANSPQTTRGDYEQGLYDKLHRDADAGKKSSESLRAQKRVDDAEIERNATVGPRSTFVNPRRSAVDRHADPEEVFSRLYADAQRYNKEKLEQERLIELKRQQERGEAPYDSDTDGVPKEGSPGQGEDDAASGEEKGAAAKRRGSVGRRKSTASPDIFQRLSRPSTVTVKFEKQKEQAEQEKREAELREAERKKSEMEKITRYNWGIPATSFKFSDLESHNAIFVS